MPAGVVVLVVIAIRNLQKDNSRPSQGYKSKSMDSNLPPDMTEDFNNEKIYTKECPRCFGIGDTEEDWDYFEYTPCECCAGRGKVELTSEEIQALEEEKREKQSQIYYQ